METWDPKPNAPAEYRGPLKAIDTNVPGVQFSELMPQQAAFMDRLAVLRTVNHGSGDHTKGNHWMLTGFEGPAFNAPDNRDQRRPALGSAVARVRRANQPGMPPYVAVPHLRVAQTCSITPRTWWRWNRYRNSDPNEKDFAVRNLVEFDLTLQRVADRPAMKLDRLHRSTEKGASGQAPAIGIDLLTNRRSGRIRHLARSDSSATTTAGTPLAKRSWRASSSGVTFVGQLRSWDHHGSPGQYKTERARLSFRRSTGRLPRGAR
jgi:hypothetical protein